MKNCLVIMSFRSSPLVDKNQIDIETIIDVCYLNNFKEFQLYKAFEILLDKTNYDNYILVSDDMLMTKQAIKLVERGLEKHEVFTGYCNLIENNDDLAVSENEDFVNQRNIFGKDSINFVKNPLTLQGEYVNINKFKDYPKREYDGPLLSDYQFMKKNEIDDFFPNKDDEGFFQVLNTGFAYFGMRKELWKKYGLYVYRRPNIKCWGGASDHLMSVRLYHDGIKMFSHKDTYAVHLKYNKKFEHGKKIRPEWHSNDCSICLKRGGGFTTNILTSSEWHEIVRCNTYLQL